MRQVKNLSATPRDNTRVVRPALRPCLFALLFTVLLPPGTFAAEPARPAVCDSDIYLFWRPGCPHCEREIEFLQRLVKEQPAVRVHPFSVSESAANRRLLRQVGALFNADVSAVPFTVAGDRAWSGYLDDATTGQAIRAQALKCLACDCPDPVRGLLRGGAVAPPTGQVARGSDLPDRIRLPFLGEVALKNLSLPALTVVLGVLDGFNPCAMWVLVLLLGILVGLPDPRRRLLLGGAFLLASAAVYFVFLSAWLNLFLFLGMLVWVQWAVGVVALIGGGYYLRQYVRNREAVCPVTAPVQRRQVFERLKRLVRRQSLRLALGGIVLLAAAVNVVELLCSAGLPAVYTHVLTLSAVPPWQYYSYLLLYVAVFLLDDLLVFIAAMHTLQVTGLGTRYVRQSRLIGGVVLTALGALLILRPEWLMLD